MNAEQTSKKTPKQEDNAKIEKSENLLEKKIKNAMSEKEVEHKATESEHKKQKKVENKK